MKLPTALEMQDLDQSTIKNYGIPSIVLMENAGLGTVRMMERELGPCQDTFALIFIGPGNNGGDGLVIGRHLHQRGCQPLFFFLVNPDTLKGDASINLQVIKKLRMPFYVVDSPARVQTIAVLVKQFESRGLPCYGIVDAIFGIGLSRDIEGHFLDAINLINEPSFNHKYPVVAADTPSGMDSDTGKTRGTSVQANYTATYCCAKPGHFIHGKSSLVGRLEIIDIGIPQEAIYRSKIATELATAKIFNRLTRPMHRRKDSHKGSHGHLLILAGSTGKTGAAVLAAKGALRAGAGLVSLCVPHDLNTIFETILVEAMTVPLTESSQNLSINDWAVIENTIDKKQAIIIGPGIGLQPQTVELVLQTYHFAKCPVILDADAINILATNHDKLYTPAGPRIFTPHPGELAKLLDKSIEDIQDNRLNAAKSGHDFLKNDQYNTIVALKGAGTIICTNKGAAIINTTGNSGMATGGMGDVLSGIIGALICQGISPHDATVAGVYLHGLAADILFKKTKIGYSATEVADMIPVALKNHRSGQIPEQLPLNWL